jgi:Flp pilus assembly pilin Flp
MSRQVLERFWRDDRAASMVEYALLVALIAAIIAIAAEVLGTKSSAKLADPALVNKLS